MPTYTVQCIKGHRSELYLTLQDYERNKTLWNIDCQCGSPADIIITAPLLVKVAADVAYDSPIDGKIINSWAARQEDLKRNNCTPYDEGMKQDYHTRIKDSEAQLDKSIDAAVEESIAKMPTAKRGKLYSELTEQGVDANVIRK